MTVTARRAVRRTSACIVTNYRALADCRPWPLRVLAALGLGLLRLDVER